MIQRGRKNLSTRSKQLISLFGCLRSSDVIIIPSEAPVSGSFQQPLQTRSSKHRDSFVPNPVQMGLTRYALEGKLSMFLKFFFSLISSPSCLLPYRDQGEAARMSHVQLETDPGRRGCECGSHVLTGQRKMPRDEAGVVPRRGCWLLPRDLTRWPLLW